VQWEPLPGLPSFCEVQRAANPEQVFHVEWESNPRAGGVEMMTVPDGLTVHTMQGAGFHDGERGYLVVRIGAQVVFVTTDGRTPGAFRHGYGARNPDGPRCEIEGVAVDRGASGFGLLSFEDDPMDRQYRIYRGPRDDLRGVVEPVAVLESDAFDRRTSIEHLAFSEEATGIVCDNELTARVDAEGTWFFPTIESNGGQSGPVSVVGRDLFWTDYTPPYRVGHATPSGDSGLFLSAGDGGDVWGFRTDGELMVWTEGGDGTLGRDPRPGKLWVAPYTSDPSRIVAREVAELDSSFQGIWGGGNWACSVDNVLVVVGLEDGTVRRYAPSFWGDLRQPLYVARDEIVVSARVRGDLRTFRLHLDELDWEP